MSGGEEEEEERESAAPGAVGDFAQKYGWPFVLVYMSISGVIFVLTYTALLWGVNMRFVMDKVGISSKAAQQTSLLLLALGLTKLAFPLKLPLAGIITYGILRRKRPPDQAHEKSEASGLLDLPPPGDNILDEEYGDDEYALDIGPTNMQL